MKKILLLCLCLVCILPIHAQDTKEHYLANAKTCFEKGEYQEARSFIVKYAMKDGDKQTAKELSTKCKSCEEYLSWANSCYIEGDFWTAERYYTKLKELNPQHPNVQSLIDKCKKTKDTKIEDGISINQTQVQPSNPTNRTKGKVKSSLKSFKSFLLDNEYCRKKQNKYFAWGILGGGYPFNAVSGFEFRGGGIIGLGLYSDFGVDFTRITVNDYHSSYGTKVYDDISHVCKTTFHYDIGIKLFPYKGLFLDFGYGSIAPVSTEVDYEYFSESDEDDKSKVRKMVSTGHGWLFHVGYNYVSKYNDSGQFFFGFNAGWAHDVANDKKYPSINLKLGMAWGR